MHLWVQRPAEAHSDHLVAFLVVFSETPMHAVDYEFSKEHHRVRKDEEERQ